MTQADYDKLHELAEALHDKLSSLRWPAPMPEQVVGLIAWHLQEAFDLGRVYERTKVNEELQALVSKTQS